jgi:hypothetical protein
MSVNPFPVPTSRILLSLVNPSNFTNCFKRVRTVDSPNLFGPHYNDYIPGRTTPLQYLQIRRNWYSLSDKQYPNYTKGKHLRSTDYKLFFSSQLTTIKFDIVFFCFLHFNKNTQRFLQLVHYRGLVITRVSKERQ